MKKLIVLLFAACAILIIAGGLSGQFDSTHKGDITSVTIDSLGNPHSGTNAAISGEDAKFAVDAANGSMAKVILGRLASQKTSNNEIRNLARMMVTDHAKDNEELRKIAAEKKISLPNSINYKESAMKTALSKKSGVDFDKAYIKAMIYDHKEDIKAFTEAGHKVKYPQMQAFIRATLPVLQKDLYIIRKIYNEIN